MLADSGQNGDRTAVGRVAKLAVYGGWWIEEVRAKVFFQQRIEGGYGVFGASEMMDLSLSLFSFTCHGIGRFSASQGCR